MKRRSKADKIDDCFTAFKCIKEGKPVKRSGAKDGSIIVRSTIEVPNIVEAQVLKDCLSWLKTHNIVCNRNNTGAGSIGASGFYSYGIKDGGDIIGLTKQGGHYELEIKRGKGGRLSKGQQKRMELIRNNKGIYLVVCGWQELELYNDRHHYFD